MYFCRAKYPMYAEMSPMIAPARTSSMKCCDRYMREYPTIMARKRKSVFCHILGQKIASVKQNAKAAEVCPDGNDSVECRSTPSIVGNWIPKSDSTTDGRGARIMRLRGVVMRVAIN